MYHVRVLLKVINHNMLCYMLYVIFKCYMLCYMLYVMHFIYYKNRPITTKVDICYK